MLLSERVPDLLPDWAFFVRCVINTEGLSPTASREALVGNDLLALTRDEIGRQLREWIIAAPTSDPSAFASFITVHQFALKSMALHDDDLARALLPHVLVETSAGLASIGELLDSGGTVRYTELVNVLGYCERRWSAAELASACWQIADDLVAQFDARNDTDHFAQMIADAHALADEHYDLPLSEPIEVNPDLPFRVVKTAEDRLTAARLYLRLGGAPDLARTETTAGLETATGSRSLQHSASCTGRSSMATNRSHRWRKSCSRAIKGGCATSCTFSWHSGTDIIDSTGRGLIQLGHLDEGIAKLLAAAMPTRRPTISLLPSRQS